MKASSDPSVEPGARLRHWALALVASLCALLLPVLAGGSGAAGPLTIDEALDDAINWGPDLSPSGRYLALVRRQDRLDMILVVDLEKPGAAPLAHAVPRAQVRWVSWATDDRLLFAANVWANKWGKTMTLEETDREGGFRFGRLIAMDRDGKNPVMLFQNDRDAAMMRDLTRITTFLPNDPRHIVAPAWHVNSFDLFKIDVFTGESRMLAEGRMGTFLWFADRDGYPAFRVDRNWTGRYAYVYARKGPGNVEPDDLEWEKVLEIPLRDDENTGAPDFYPLHAGPEPNTYYVAARPDGADTSGIYLYDFVEKKYLKTLATEPGIDIERMFVNVETRAFLGASYYADRKVTRFADPALQRQFDALDKYFGGEVDTYLVGHDRGMTNWLLFTIGPRDRGSWHVYRLKDRFVTEVAHSHPPIAAARLGATRVLRFRARDGSEIMGYLTTPPGVAETAPLVLLPHGGPEVRDHYQFDEFVQMLASRGYQVFQPNFRGSSGFGRRFADAGKRQWGGAMQDDLTDAFEFLVKTGVAARDRACIVGFSYGGYAALAAATQTPELFRCAVSIAGVADLPKLLKHERRRFRDAPVAWAYVKRQIGDPDHDEAMLKSRSPARHAIAVTRPVLLIHGEDDGRVPIEQSELMEKALRKAGKDVRFVRLKGQGHSFDDAGWRLAYPAILEFLEKHLSPAAAEPRPVSAASDRSCAAASSPAAPSARSSCP